MPDPFHDAHVPMPECSCLECLREQVAARDGVKVIDAGGYVTRDHVRVAHQLDDDRPPVPRYA